jgi:hypothetical protein
MTNVSLAGRAIDVDLGPFVVHLAFLENSSIRIKAQIGDHTIDDTVPVNVQPLQPDLFLVTWLESSGNYIVQLQDYQNGVVHNRARLADGSLFEVEATMKAA